MSLGMPNIVYPKENLITIDTMSSRMKNILDAWLKYGTVFLIYRLCSYYFLDRDNPDEELFDQESVKLALFILLGFTIYYLVVKPYIPVHLEHPILRNIANDTLMFGTVLVSMHLMETYMDDGDYFNGEWFKTAGLILLAFASYRVLIDPFIPFNKLSPNIKPIISDWAQFGTFLVAFRLLQGKEFNQSWFLSVLFVLLGFTGYHLITKKLIKVE